MIIERIVVSLPLLGLLALSIHIRGAVRHSAHRVIPIWYQLLAVMVLIGLVAIWVNPVHAAAIILCSTCYGLVCGAHTL